MMDIGNSNIEINDVIIDFDDFKEFSKASIYNKIIKVWRGLGVIYVSLFVLILLIMLLIDNTGSSKSNSVNIMSLGVLSRLSDFLFMFFVLFIMPWFIYPAIVNKKVKRAFANNKLIQKPRKYIIDDLGFKVVWSNGENSFQWNDLYIINETQSYLALYISKNQAFIIPRRFLENRADVINYVKNKVPAKYRIIKRGLNIT